MECELQQNFQAFLETNEGEQLKHAPKLPFNSRTYRTHLRVELLLRWGKVSITVGYSKCARIGYAGSPWRRYTAGVWLAGTIHVRVQLGQKPRINQQERVMPVSFPGTVEIDDHPVRQHNALKLQCMHSFVPLEKKTLS